MLSKSKNIWKNYKEKLLGVLWFLNSVSAMGHGITAVSSKCEYFRNHKTQTYFVVLTGKSV